LDSHTIFEKFLFIVLYGERILMDDQRVARLPA